METRYLTIVISGFPECLTLVMVFKTNTIQCNDVVDDATVFWSCLICFVKRNQDEEILRSSLEDNRPRKRSSLWAE